ncbi:hypothetical protein D9M68_414450 [compost metagenome]
MAGHHGQQHGHVAGRAPHRAFVGQLLQEHFGRRAEGHAPGRRPHAVDVAEGGRIAQRSAEIAAIRHRQHAGRQRRRRAAAAAAGGPGRVVGIAGGAIHLVVSMRPQPELRHIAAADEERAGRPHALDHDRVVRRHQVLVDERPHRSDHAAHRRQVLGRLRHAVKPAQPLARVQLSIALGGLAHQFVAIAPGDDGIELGVDPVDMRQIGGHDLAAGHLAQPDGLG